MPSQKVDHKGVNKAGTDLWSVLGRNIGAFSNIDRLSPVVGGMHDQYPKAVDLSTHGTASRDTKIQDYTSLQSHSATPSALPRNEGDAGRAANVGEISSQQELDALIKKGSSLHRLGKTDDAIACFEAARRIAPDRELVLTNLAVALADSGLRHDAVVVFRRILKFNPENLYVRHQLRRLISIIVPFWHARMLNDTT